MADLIYNPLLKKGFQETSDTGSIEAEIEDLRQKKVTKCETTDELTAVEEAEIFQWQGADTSEPAELVNGYFYKKTTSQITIASGTFYVNFQNDFITPLFTIPKGYYYYVEDTTINYGYEIQKSFDNILWLSIQPCAIGNPITSVNGDVAYLTSVNNNYPVSDSLGRNWSNPTQILSSGTFKKFKNYETGLELLLALTNPVDIVSAIDFFAFLYNDLLFPIYSFGLPAIKTTRETSITVAVFAQTNNQPPTPGITEENGTLKVSFPVEFADDVTVKGTQTVVHTEEIESENDYIELRADNPLALASGETSGISVNNYDGNNTDCILAVDKDGWARVGDSSGTLEKIATIEETPTDAQFVQYDAQNKQLITAATPEATTTDAGLMSVADKLKLNSFGNDLWQDITPTSFNSFTCSAKIIQYGRLVNIYITFTNTTNVGIKSRIMEIPILCNAILYDYVFWCYSGDDTVPPIPILLGRRDNHITIYVAAAYNANNSYRGAFLVLN